MNFTKEKHHQERLEDCASLSLSDLGGAKEVIWVDTLGYIPKALCEIQVAEAKKALSWEPHQFQVDIGDHKLEVNFSYADNVIYCQYVDFRAKGEFKLHLSQCNEMRIDFRHKAYMEAAPYFYASLSDRRIEFSLSELREAKINEYNFLEIDKVIYFYLVRALKESIEYHEKSTLVLNYKDLTDDLKKHIEDNKVYDHFRFYVCNVPEGTAPWDVINGGGPILIHASKGRSDEDHFNSTKKLVDSCYRVGRIERESSGSYQFYQGSDIVN